MIDLGSNRKLKALALKTGSVFRMTLYPEDGITPKNTNDKSRDKYFVVIGIDNETIMVGSILINSNINPKKFNKIADLQYMVSCDDYEFLNGKDRYIDCSELFEIRYDRILSCAEYIGVIDEKHLYDIINLVKISPYIRKGTLKKYMLLSE